MQARCLRVCIGPIEDDLEIVARATSEASIKHIGECGRGDDDHEEHRLGQQRISGIVGVECDEEYA